MSPKPSPRRCAVYTRKSSEDGLEQDFNSLHAQREACEAFIKSQHGEGWLLVDARYDDGGLSGGNMERPALKRLLADVALGKVNVIVVYKVDRLTRSLADFAKMVEVFDAKGASFVAVTQQFNTTTSMGRLTLNVLLSFAQFEREVTGERIRDKIAASKRKGMWMGGTVPLGYEVKERKLIIVPEEVKTVNEIFRTYLQLGCVRKLKQNLDGRKIRSKRRTTKSGTPSGGASFSRGALYALLSNPIYIGDIRHKELCHPGQHEPITDRVLWDAVQLKLKSQAVRAGIPNRKTESSLLTGKLFDEAGKPLTPSHALKQGRRYRYYISQGVLRKDGQLSGDRLAGWRLPAREIEQAVMGAIRLMLRDQSGIARSAEVAGIAPGALPRVLNQASRWDDQLNADGDPAELIKEILDRVVLRSDGIEVSIRLSLLEREETVSLALCRFVPVRMKRRGVEMRMVIGGVDARPIRLDQTLIKAMAKGRLWFDQLASGRSTSVTAIAKENGVTERWVSRIIPLAFLSPEIVKSILEGTQPDEMTTQSLLYGRPLEADWNQQKQQLGFV